MIEPKVSINGQDLTDQESRTLCVALTCFIIQLKDKSFTDQLGSITIEYELNLRKIFGYIDETVQ
jgi:hypothetical protein